MSLSVAHSSSQEAFLRSIAQELELERSAILGSNNFLKILNKI
jgi:hypothetical protein